MKSINGQITILSDYKGFVTIRIYDKDASIEFIELILTREQFINASMNRLAHTDVFQTYVEDNLDRLGKIMVTRRIEFELERGTVFRDKIAAAEQVKKYLEEGEIADTSFSSQDSFFRADDKMFAVTIGRKWVDKEE